MDDPLCSAHVSPQPSKRFKKCAEKLSQIVTDRRPRAVPAAGQAAVAAGQTCRTSRIARDSNRLHD
jgi:hypothetical protein